MDTTPSTNSSAAQSAAATRLCTKCLAVLPLSAFEKDSRGYGDGYRRRCASCCYKRGLEWKKRTGYSQSAALREWRSQPVNAAKTKAYAKRYRTENADAERARIKAWKRRNPHKGRASTAKYDAQKLRATPAWADMAAIADVYKHAAEMEQVTGVAHHVDHIVPLQSALVCGLHVHKNLGAASV